MVNTQPRTENVTLKIGGMRFGHWQRVQYRSSVDDLCASISLDVTRPGAARLPVDENTVIEVLIGEKLVQTVRIDCLAQSMSPTAHRIAISARSLGREFVDCQYSKTLNGLKLGDIIAQLGADFSVPIMVNAKTENVPNFAMQCEAPANALLNAARSANLLLYPLPNGGLILTEPTSEPAVATLRFGERIKEYEIIDEFRLRFSEYLVKAFDHDGNRATRSSIVDDGFLYFRPMQIIADKHGSTTGGCDRRAELERNRRLARAHRIVLTVSGWEYFDENKEKSTWAINTQVRVVIPHENIDAVLLIGELNLRLDDRGGHVATLTVMDRNAFLGQKSKKKGKRKSAGDGGSGDLAQFYPKGDKLDE